MKYLLTESQINKFINKMIQSTIQELREECEDRDESLEPGEWYNWSDCDLVDSLEKIVVNDIEKRETKSDYYGSFHPAFTVLVSIYYNSIFAAQDFNDLRGVLHYRIFQKYRMKLYIIIEEEINTKTNREW
jgi:hypothetical protein